MKNWFKRNPLPLHDTPFLGIKGEQQNALNSALITATLEADFLDVHSYLESIHKSDIVVGLVTSLNRHGYRIEKDERIS